MNHTQELDKLAPALAKAQSEMGGAVKDSDNPFFHSKYADLSSVWKACKEALHNNGFSVVQSPINEEGRIGVSTMLLHESGQFITDRYTIGVKKQNDPQADGSSITYARRYALAAFVGVCPVDDDAEGAMFREKPKKKKVQASGPPPADDNPMPEEFPTEAQMQKNFTAWVAHGKKCTSHGSFNQFLKDNRNQIKHDLGGDGSPFNLDFTEWVAQRQNELKKAA